MARNSIGEFCRIWYNSPVIRVTACQPLLAVTGVDIFVLGPIFFRAISYICQKRGIGIALEYVPII
jgi:hypothetical protein